MHVFFIQFDPDIDIIVPIVYKLVLNNKKISIICINPQKDIYNDYRFQYLRNYSKLNILYLHQINLPLKLLSKVLFILASTLSETQVEKFYAFYMKNFLIGRWLNLFFKKNNVISVTVDEAIPNHALNIIQCAKNSGILSVMLPTGALMFKQNKNELDDDSIFNIGFMTDYKIVSPKIDVSRLSHEVICFGVSRYCSEWQDVHSKIIGNLGDGYKFPATKGKLKVLIFSRPSIGLKKDSSLLSKISSEKNILLIFKDKPRGVKDRNEMYDSYPSALLIQWADVVIGSVSSIVLDILHYKKQFIFLKYMSDERVGELDNSSVCLVAKNEDMVMSYLSNIILNKRIYNYSNDKIKKYYDDIVYESKSSFDVLGDYYKFYNSLNKTH
ncbi:MAG: hypothetical protein HN480_02315 [Gammaproteobacteria bacterium]|jgi:hypothetical protein|nr:hypothetical protein [Gammaproteobacteria bacterium]